MTKISHLMYFICFVLWAVFVWPKTSEAIVTATSESLIFGVQTHFAQNKGIPASNLSLIRQSNILSIRDEVYWSQVERQKGVYVIPEHVTKVFNAAISSGIRPLIILDYGNRFYDGAGMPVSEESQAAFVRYVEFVARYFKGKVHHYEIWNEWNIGAGNIQPKPPFKGDSAAYVRLLSKSYAAIKRIDPTAIVLGGAVSGWDAAWIDELLKNGAISYLDGLSIHPYSYNSYWEGRPEKLIDWLGTIEEKIKKKSNVRMVPLYITEIGWPNHIDDLGTQPEVTANYLSRLFLLASAKPFINGIWWYDFQDDGLNKNDPEHNFGLITYDGTPKPAWFMMRDIAGQLRLARFVSQLPTDPGLFALRFVKNNGTSFLAIWTDRKTQKARVTVKFPGSTLTEVKLQQPGRGEPFVSMPLSGDTVSFSLTATGTPWLVHG
ncbi:MAG: hypothetical protein ACYC2P_13065, partial [Paludibacteraceae bacterium]